MKYHFKQYKILLLLFDIFILISTLFLSYYIKFLEIPPLSGFEKIIFFALVCVAIFFIFDLYNPWSHYTRIRIHYKSLIATPIVIAVFLIFSFLFANDSNNFFGSKTVFLTLIFLSTPVFFLSRYFFYHFIDPEKLDIRLLVIGTKNIAMHFQNELNIRGGKWKAFYLVDRNDKIDDDIENKPDINIFGNVEDDFEKAIQQKWTAIIVAKKDLDKEKIMKLFELKQKGELIYDLIHFYEYYFFKIPLYYIDEYWFLSTKGFLIVENQTIIRIKRIIEVIISAIILILTSPILLITAIAIYLEDGKPVFFRQERLGKDKKPFTVIKFRTMIKDAEKYDPYTRENDKRLLKIGKFLRKTRIDEIPQLLKIITGEMSLIGPRPEQTKLTAIYEKEIPYYHFRHYMLPGITGWAQVMYPYVASKEDTIQKLEYDLYYIKNYSLLLDLSIVIKTVRTVLFGGGR